MPERKLVYADTVVEKLSELIELDDHEKKVVESYVEQCMAVDAEEVIHAHWIPDGEYDICSNCNNPIIMNRLSPDRRCKNCGAKMNRERRDAECSM
jgi:RNA polymerase-binding transcription factor DksA